jgi:hypothetical protein
MFRSILFSVMVLMLFSFCRTKNTKAQTTRPSGTPQTLSGTVSHKQGKCGTVVLVRTAGPDMILVPYPALDTKFDGDGLSIQFTYRKLSIPQREGCEQGIMAELSDVKKSN